MENLNLSAGRRPKFSVMSLSEVASTILQELIFILPKLSTFIWKMKKYLKE